MEMHGREVTIMCNGDRLNQVYYYYNVRGNAIDGVYKDSAAREFFFLSLVRLMG